MEGFGSFWQGMKRRCFLRQTGGFGAAALSGLLEGKLSAQSNPLAPKKPHAPPRAKRVIYLHMIGAPSHLDLFDYKPELVKRDGQLCPDSFLQGRRFAFIGGKMALAGSRFRFKKAGKSGQEFSELLPALSTMADQISIVKTLHTEEINHAPAQMFLHTGFGRGGRPAFGSWVTYGLGSDADNLPAYVVLLSGPPGGAGTSLWSNGFLPGVYQGIQFRSSGDPVLFLSNPPGLTPQQRSEEIQTINALNAKRFGATFDPEIETRIAQYELAFKMQTSVPDLMDLAQESAASLRLYGAKPGAASFANNCLLARRLIERGVRVVELYDADWDHHSNLDRSLARKAQEVDRPMAALLLDLQQRGLLEETLVIWGAEFGRTPLRQGIDGEGKSTNPGRDHHKDAFCAWMAGGGIRPGQTIGKTDEFGFSPVEDPVHVHDLNATALHLLGLDHERLTYKYQGREFRLTDVHGQVVKKLLS